jgi:DNA polymerase III alpha subunit
MSKNYVDYRSFLMANVETMLQAASTLRQSAGIESEDLFGAEVDDQNTGKTDIQWIQKADNLSPFQVLLKEKDSLGLFVSGNPLDEYQPILEWVQETAARDDIHLVLITKIRKIFTKAGQMMFALQITIYNAEVEGVIFPKKAMDLSPRLAEGELFWVRGKISVPKKRDTKQKPLPSTPIADANEDLDTSGEGNVEQPISETVEEVKEYDELPKLLIDNLVPFQEGALAVLADEDIRISINREKLFKSVNWERLKVDPNSFHENFGERDNKRAPEDKSGKPKLIKLTKDVGANALMEVKQNLKKTPETGTIEVEVWVENLGELKKVKGQFWLPESIAKNY